MNTFLGVTFETLVILGLVAANGFFVAAEFALVKIRVSQLRPLLKSGNWRVKFALKATEHLDAALSATQLGITLASLGLGWAGEPFIAHRMSALLAHVGIKDPNTISSVSFLGAFAVITFFHIIFGELAPKSLAIQRAKDVSLIVAAPLLIFYYIFFPFIWVLNGTANLFLRWGGLKPAGESEHAFAPEELEYVLTHARHSHPADALINKLMVQSLRLRQAVAQQIMIPREQIVALWLDKSQEENLRIAQTSGHSRYPVCSGEIDQVKGLLVVREWLWQLQALGPDASFAPLLRPALIFELKTPFHTMIEEFRSKRTHLAVVLDEQKKLAGIVAFEDVIEEIVGDIRDEFDTGPALVTDLQSNTVVVVGATTMRELRAETGWSFEWLPRETISSWSVRHLGRVPRRDESFSVGEYRLTALDVTSDRIRRIKIERILAEE